MRGRNSYRIATITSIGVIALAVVYSVTDHSRPQEIIVMATAIVGAVAIWFQMKRARDVAEGEFIMQLNESFSSNDDVKALYAKLIAGTPLGADDRTSIVEYLTFFETIYLLLRREVVDLKLLDSLFRYRFYIAVDNPDIQDLELVADAPFYTNVYALYDLWTKHRRRNGGVYDSPTALERRDPAYRTHADLRAQPA